MKKVLSVLTTLFIMISVMGFTPNQQEFFGETQRLSKWNAVEIKGSVKVGYPLFNDGMKILDFDFQTKVDTSSSESEISLSNIQVLSGRNYPLMKIFWDRKTSYYDIKSLLIILSEFFDENMSEYTQVKDSYIGYTVDVDRLESIDFYGYDEIRFYGFLLRAISDPHSFIQNYDQFFVGMTKSPIEVQKQGSSYIIYSNLYEFGKLGKLYLQKLNLASKAELEKYSLFLEEKKEELRKISIQYTLELGEDSYKGKVKVWVDSYLGNGEDELLDIRFQAIKKESLSIEMPQSYILFDFNKIEEQRKKRYENLKLEDSALSPTEEKESSTLEKESEDILIQSEAKGLEESNQSFMEIRLDGSYMKGRIQGQLDFKNIYGNMYIRKTQLEELLDITIDSIQEYLSIQSIEDYDQDYFVLWNEENRSIQIYKY